MKDNKTKVITLAALIIAVIGLSIGFAAFASTLNIQTGATVTPNDTFSVKFASSVTGSNGEFTQFSVTPTVAVTSTSDNGAIAGTPEIDNTNNPTIGNLSASFTRPGQSVTYTFYVVNDGNYDAYLTNLVFNNAIGANSFKDCVSDSLSSNPATQSLVDNVCNNITFTMSIGSDSNITSSTTLTNHLLEKSHYELVTVTIAYQGDAYADGAFKVNFGDIDLHYRTIDEVEEVATQDTPATSEQVVIDNLIPTDAELGAALFSDETPLLKYTFGVSVEYKEYGTAKFVVVGNNEYVWFCDVESASMFGNLDANVWYYLEDGSPSSNQYLGPNPINISEYEDVNENVRSYVTRVINSFNN